MLSRTYERLWLADFAFGDSDSAIHDEDRRHEQINGSRLWEDGRGRFGGVVWTAILTTRG